jgi:hypothetical protein
MKNQRSEQLFDAIGTLSEDMIAAAAPTGRAKILRTRRLATAAACLVCACAVGFGAWGAGVFGSDPEIEKNPYGEESVRAERGEPAPAPWRSWDSLPTGLRGEDSMRWVGLLWELWPLAVAKFGWILRGSDSPPKATFRYACRSMRMHYIGAFR